MFKLINSFLKPNIINIQNIDIFRSKIVLEPMEKGFGNTIGNSLRRILLSSIPGYKITEIEIKDVCHEFSFINGIKEDILEIVSNIKNIPIKILNGLDLEYIEINSNNIIGNVTTNNIVYNKNISIIDKNYYLFSISDKDIILNIKMKVKKGIGYLYNNILDKKNNIGKILVDTHFSPINKVIYYVENTRVNNKIDLDKLTIEIETNGTISPEESIKISANILINQLNIFLDLKKFTNNYFINNEEKKYSKIENDDKKYNENYFFNKLIELYKFYNINPILLKKINNLNLTIRSLNCLKKCNIIYIGDLIKNKEQELLKISNLGKKSLIEIKNSLDNLNLKLNTNIENWNIIINDFSNIINKK